MPHDIYGYKIQHHDFPDESTGDQIFDEKQFEAYRELGFQLGQRMVAGVESEQQDFNMNPELLKRLRDHIVRMRESQTVPNTEAKL